VIIHAVLDHLWESTLFAVAAGLVTLFLRNNPARVRYWVWFAASLKFVVPFYLLTWAGSHIHWRNATAALPGSMPIGDTLQHLGHALATPAIAFRVPAPEALSLVPICVSIWAVGCVAVLARWVASWLQMRAIVRSAGLTNVSAPIPVRLAPAPFEPAVIGIIRPLLLLPAGIQERLTAAELETVIAHEMCHVRRRDNLTAAVHMVLEAIFWFHPLIWWIGARLLEERERACDEAVVGLGKDSQTYAESILKVCRFYVESKLACVAGISGSNLKRRVKTIMRNRVMDRLSTFKKLALTAAAAAVVVVPVAVGLASSPSVVAQLAAGAELAQPHFRSVRVARSAPGVNQWLGFPDGQFSTSRMPIRDVIAFAYGIHRLQVKGGADWLDKQLYDITAETTPSSAATAMGAASPDVSSMAPMVRQLLASRFGLVAHSETQNLPAYVLRVDAGGSKLNPALPAGPHGNEEPPRMKLRPNLLMAESSDVKALTDLLATNLGHPVVDETGLKGRYDFAVTGPLDEASLPKALQQQLGLTLAPKTAPIEVVVVDSIQQPSLDSPAGPTT
jgi:bla regulator protein blaR1